MQMESKRIHKYSAIFEFFENIAMMVGGRGRNRTVNQWIKSPLLYQLSYAPMNGSIQIDRPGRSAYIHVCLY